MSELTGIDRGMVELWWCPTHGSVDEGSLVEGQDPSLANASDPDGWTDTYYCCDCRHEVRLTAFAFAGTVERLESALREIDSHIGLSTQGNPTLEEIRRVVHSALGIPPDTSTSWANSPFGAVEIDYDRP